MKKPRIAPQIREFAALNEVPLDSVQGTGKNGAMTQDDVVRAMTARAKERRALRSDVVALEGDERDYPPQGAGDAEVDLTDEQRERALREAAEYASQGKSPWANAADALEETNRLDMDESRRQKDERMATAPKIRRDTPRPWAEKSWKPDWTRIPKRPGWSRFWAHEEQLQRRLDEGHQVANAKDYGLSRHGENVSGSSMIKRKRHILVEIPDVWAEDRRRQIAAMTAHQTTSHIDKAVRSGMITPEPGHFGGIRQRKKLPVQRESGAIGSFWS